MPTQKGMPSDIESVDETDDEDRRSSCTSQALRADFGVGSQYLKWKRKTLKTQVSFQENIEYVYDGHFRPLTTA